ncbi:DeoR/GlpR family DNA-binding transcription regulator [Sneathiella chinensis]|uniref:DeoR family transcriptional regulator n=1 Tax=Sneathiella chinensis TaxID=349750 RepID=A0ABQ5U5W4_9PROT|nr:DeoR/GlpR family DNA-binding transcription regulator [Sneathiella chinensis]GLQ06618.1 DeoR family transcriptional regulator [Sneathiella chinensis]
MLAEERYFLIMRELSRFGAVTIRDLSDRFGMSRETVRRDISHLAEQGKLTQIRGGALSPSRKEPDLEERLKSSPEGKRAIGRHVAGLIPDGASVLLDSGSTTLAVAEALLDHKDLKILTNDMRICLLLGRVPGNEAALLGGRLASFEDSVGGWDTVDMLSRYSVDYGVIGVAALSAEPAVMTFDREGAALREAMIRSARIPVIVADHSKFGGVADCRIRGAEKVAYLVTDQAPGSDMRAALDRLPAELIVTERS